MLAEVAQSLEQLHPSPLRREHIAHLAYGTGKYQASSSVKTREVLLIPHKSPMEPRRAAFLVYRVTLPLVVEKERRYLVLRLVLTDKRVDRRRDKTRRTSSRTTGKVGMASLMVSLR